MEACKKFLERAKRRVARAEEVINRAQEQRVIYMEEVEEAEKRDVGVAGGGGASLPPSSLPEVGELQRQIAELIRERDFLRQSVSTGVPQGSAGRMVLKRHSRSDQRASNANEPPGFGRMDQQPQLRVAKRSRIRGCAFDSKDRHIVEPRCSVVGIHESRRADGGEVRSRCEAQMSGCGHGIDVAHPESSIKREERPVTGTEVCESVRPTIQALHTAVLQLMCWTVSSSTLQRIDSDTDDEPLVRPFNRNVAQRRSIEDAPSRVPITATEEDESMVPSSTIPASSGRVRAVHGRLRRAVSESVQQRAERLMPVDSSSPRQGGWVVDMTAGDSEEDNEDPGLDARVRVPVDTDEEFQDVVCALEHDLEGVVPMDVPVPGSATSPPQNEFEATSSQPRRRRLRIIPVVAQDEVRLTPSTIPGVLPNAPEVHPTGPTAVDAASTGVHPGCGGSEDECGTILIGRREMAHLTSKLGLSRRFRRSNHWRFQCVCATLQLVWPVWML